jgi:hypothetical protein
MLTVLVGLTGLLIVLALGAALTCEEPAEDDAGALPR